VNGKSARMENGVCPKQLVHGKQSFFFFDIMHGVVQVIWPMRGYVQIGMWGMSVNGKEQDPGECEDAARIRAAENEQACKWSVVMT
jgi:hypothetical protein